MRQHAAAMLRQMHQQAVFDGCQVQCVAGVGDAALDQIHHHVAKRNLRRAIGGAILPAAQLRAHARQQLAGAKGLDQVVVGPGVQRGDLVLFAAARRQHDHRRL